MKYNLVKVWDSKRIINRYSQIIIVFVFLWPVLFSYLLYPDTFGFTWNAGRGGFLIATVLTLIEVLGSRPIIGCHEIMLLIIIAILIVLYFIGLSFGVSNILSDMGRAVGVLVHESWKSMWDYLVLAIYFSLALIFIFGKKDWIIIGGASSIFLFGYATILLLDSLFPYDTLGVFQFLVPPYLNLNAAILDLIINIMNYQPESASEIFNNTLVLYTAEGPFVMKVYWPSAGVHSIVIFGLVMFAFFLKTNIPGKRMLFYLASGVLLTSVVNAIRITLLSLYALDPNSDSSNWEQFHSVIGEVIFIPWIILYVAFVIRLEKWHNRKGKPSLRENSYCNNGREAGHRVSPGVRPRR